LKDKDQIAEMFKQGLDGYQAKVDPAIWSSIQSSLGTAATSTASAAASGVSISKIIIGAAAAIAATTTTVFFVVNSKDKATSNKTEVLVQEELVDENKSPDLEDATKLNEEITTNENVDIVDEPSIIIELNEDTANQPFINDELEKAKNSTDNLETEVAKPSISLAEDLETKPVVRYEQNTNHLNKSADTKEEELLSEVDLFVNISKEKISAQHFKLRAETIENANINWDFGDGYFSKGADVEHVFNEPGRYLVYVTVISDNQEVTDFIEIEVAAYGSIDHLPNVFSPDGDGINDELFISASHIKDFQITVFDSKNNVVYQSNDVNFRWNGIDIKSGLPAPAGSYYYIITASDEQGNNINKFQHLTIKR
jgi:gliding motility-associated-like protein